ncbi:hypothetical protein LOAG_07444 [Loa loa]|uniref:Uncharacterized protein n=1 Tax=Loa loa TaxID=7209 RepID=A0A1S0TXA0_LOALO|nr:hypothetical protein LOAG_07444 [Loa loa]EFO21043.1 hypothetical protein LOAG_07444 [Loa loa]
MKAGGIGLAGRVGYCSSAKMLRRSIRRFALSISLLTVIYTTAVLIMDYQASFFSRMVPELFS